MAKVQPLPVTFQYSSSCVAKKPSWRAVGSGSHRCARRAAAARRGCRCECARRCPATQRVVFVSTVAAHADHVQRHAHRVAGAIAVLGRKIAQDAAPDRLPFERTTIVSVTARPPSHRSRCRRRSRRSVPAHRPPPPGRATPGEPALHSFTSTWSRSSVSKNAGRERRTAARRSAPGNFAAGGELLHGAVVEAAGVLKAVLDSTSFVDRSRSWHRPSTPDSSPAAAARATARRRALPRASVARASLRHVPRCACCACARSSTTASSVARS